MLMLYCGNENCARDILGLWFLESIADLPNYKQIGVIIYFLDISYIEEFKLYMSHVVCLWSSSHILLRVID